MRVGFVVNKAVGNSVIRHRVTRRLRHLACGTGSPRLPAAGTLVVRALPAQRRLARPSSLADLARCLRRVIAVDAGMKYLLIALSEGLSRC